MVGVDDAGLMKVRRKSDGPTKEEKSASETKRGEKAKERQKRKRAAAAEAAGRTPGRPGNPKLNKAKPTTMASPAVRTDEG